MCFIATIAVAGLFLQAPAAAPKDEEAARRAGAERLAVMKAAASLYRFQPGRAGQPGADLHAEPLLRWTNPVAQEEDAALFLWTSEGRPEAAAQFFVRKERGLDNWMHEFQSLSEGPFSVRWGGRTVWEPTGPGVRFRAVPDAPAPEGAATRRLQQMREIARTFAASVEFQYDGASHYELRLLPRPVYRYGKEGGAVAVIDGTLWAFVQGTNPEVLLLIEARRSTASRDEWHYALAPMTSYPAEVHQGGKPVWKVARQPIPTPDSRGVYLFRAHVPETPE